MGIMTQLSQIVTGTGTWPPPGVGETWEQIELFEAFLRSDDTRLRQEASVKWRDRYLISPVPRMISRAKANLLFGELPEFTAEKEQDQVNLDRITSEQDLASELHRAAVMTSAEGEVWGRIVVSPDVLDVPIIEFVSRSRVLPHFAGRFVTGATFITEWQTSGTERVRMFESYDAGSVVTTLYRGSSTRLGAQIGLDTFEATRGRQETVLTGIDWPLVAFIPNSIDSDPTRGYSDYQGLRDRFLALNETLTVGQANLRLAGRKRAIVDASGLDPNGRVPAGDDVYIRTSRERGDGVNTTPLQVIDYSFQADQTVAWLDHLIDTTLTLGGVAPQAVGRSVDGGTISGTALKLRMTHSLLEAAGTGRYFDRGVRRLLRGAQILDGRSVGEGGFGRHYVDRDTEPTVQRGDGLPRDDMEAAEQLFRLVSSDAISVEERVAFLHPEWTEEQRKDEVGLLKAEQSPAMPRLPFDDHTDPAVPSPQSAAPAIEE